MYNPVSNKTDFNRMEEEVLAFWKEHDTFAKSLEQTKDRDAFVFYDGPPFATGLPHYGHLLAGTIKDIIPRYQTMRGHHVERRFGWDCHGSPSRPSPRRHSASPAPTASANTASPSSTRRAAPWSCATSANGAAP